MSTRIAGSSHFQRRASASRRRTIKLVIILVLLAVGALILHSAFVAKAAHKQAAAVTQPKPSYGAEQAQDVNLVAGAVGQYAAASNALPQRLAVSNGSLVLCASVCDSSAYEVGGFSVYEASSIKLVPYTPGLAVSSQADMYLVPGAKCARDGHLDGANTDPRSMVILFAVVVGTTTAPRCVVL